MCFSFFLIDLLVSVIGVCILCNQHSCSGRSLMSAQMQSSLRDSGVVSFSSSKHKKIEVSGK